jgi:hypothetical protein
VVRESFVRATPDWHPGDRLPITEASAVRAAKAELARHLPNISQRKYDGVDIIHFQGVAGSKYYFLVYFTGRVDSPYWLHRAFVPVNFKGEVSPLSKPKDN